MAKFPLKGECVLANPWFGDNPPFAVLSIDFRTRTGTARWGRIDRGGREAPINPVSLEMREEGPKFWGLYRIAKQDNLQATNSGMFEATIKDKYRLEIEFTGAIKTSVKAEPASTAAIEEGDLGIALAPAPVDNTPRGSIDCAGDIANYFDSLVKENSREIENWVRDTTAKHPDAWWAVGLAKTVYDVPVVLGQGMVDALRLGEGTARAMYQEEGGWGAAKGIGQDALRLLQFIPAFGALKLVRPVSAEARALSAEARALGAEGRALSAEGRALGAEARSVAPGAGGAPGIAARAPAARPLPPLEPPKAPLPWSSSMNLVNRPGQVCTWVATTQAVRMVKATAYVTIETLLSVGRAVGVTPGPAGTYIKELMPVLAKIGVRLRPLASAVPAGTSAETIATLAGGAPGRVVLFEISWVTNVRGVVQRVGHTLVAFNSSNGVRILDRTGAIARRVADLESIGGGMNGYRGIGTALLQNAYVIEDATVKLAPNGAGKLVASLAVTVAVSLHAVTPVSGAGGAPAQSPAPSTGAAQPAPR